MIHFICDVLVHVYTQHLFFKTSEMVFRLGLTGPMILDIKVVAGWVLRIWTWERGGVDLDLGGGGQ